MTTATIPGAVLVEIDESLIPAGPKGDPGPPGAGIVVQKVVSQIVPGAITDSSTWVSTGYSITITPSSVTNEIHLEARGRVGHTAAGTIVHFTWFKGGTNLTPTGKIALDSARVENVDCAERFDLGTLVDVPGVTTPVVYDFSWKTVGPTAHLGERPGDGSLNSGAVMLATEVMS